MVILEAAAEGVPAIATDLGGTPELIRDGVTGLLVPPESAPALADAMTSIAMDSAATNRMGTAAWQRVRACHDPQQHLARLLDAYGAAAGSSVAVTSA